MTIPNEAPQDFPPPIGEPEPDSPSGKPVRGRTAIAWCVILLLSALVAIGMQMRPKMGDEPVAVGHAEESPVGDIVATVAEVQGKMIVALAEFVRADKSGQAETNLREIRRQIETMNEGPPSARLRYVVLLGELGTPEDAIHGLEELRLDLAKVDRELDPEDEEVAALIEKIYVSYERDPKQSPKLSEAQTRLLQEQLGWYADLALAPDNGPNPQLRKQLVGTAQKALGVAVVAGVIGGSVFLAGIVLLATLLILAATGKIRSSILLSGVHPGIYAETFACWMVLYIGLNLGLGLLIGAMEPEDPDQQGNSLSELGRWLAPLGAQVLSLSALAWPVLRGIRFSDMRSDIGLFLPGKKWLEPFLGIATYAMSLPILAVGVIMTILLMTIQQLFAGGNDPFGTPNVPAHPIIETVRDGNPWTFWVILLLAAVGAPIVEELMFRGVLYRSLRDSTRWLRGLGSIVASIAISGFLFAAVHPQGWVAIPALGALATGFAIAREWRGTIWPSVIAHGLNNGLVTVLLFTVFA